LLQRAERVGDTELEIVPDAHTIVAPCDDERATLQDETAGTGSRKLHLQESFNTHVPVFPEDFFDQRRAFTADEQCAIRGLQDAQARPRPQGPGPRSAGARASIKTNGILSDGVPGIAATEEQSAAFAVSHEKATFTDTIQDACKRLPCWATIEEELGVALRIATHDQDIRA
jgi:hypothetical protein